MGNKSKVNSLSLSWQHRNVHAAHDMNSMLRGEETISSSKLGLKQEWLL